MLRALSPSGWRKGYGVTRYATLLFSPPRGVVTWTSPVVAPGGTLVVIREPDATMNAAAVPFKCHGGRAREIRS